MIILLLAALHVIGIAGTEHTLDQEYHLKESESVTLTEKDETWARKEMRTKGGAHQGSTSMHMASASAGAAAITTPTSAQLRKTGAVSTYALGLAPKARSTDSSENDHAFAHPREGLVVSMINKKYEWTRPFDKDGSVGFMHGSSSGGNELWHFEPQMNENEWIIYNAGTKKALECGSDYYLRLKEPSDLTSKMKFKFVDAGEGWYYVENIDRPGAYLAADSEARGFCWKPEEVHLCVEDGWYSGHCWYDDCDTCQHGQRYSGAKDWCCHAGDLYNHNDCSCEAGDMISVTDADGKPDDRFKWRFEDLYASSSKWDLIFQYSNARGCNAKKVLSITKGYTSTFETTTAVSIGYEFGITASAKEGIKAASFEESVETKLTSEVSSSVTSSSTEYVEETVETEFFIAAHSCMKYMQIQVTQKDSFTGKDLVFGSGVYQKEVYCNEDDPEFIGVPDETTCPPDEVIDITVETSVAEPQEDSVRKEEEESLFVAELETFELTTNQQAVYGLAAVGLGVVLYGAMKHYTQKAEGSFEEIKPLEP